ncbi:mannose-1-phosphate guanylyltransferase/mannose-6-phosphate isomerase [Propylenella binzhouense]|uniref:mannose-1-phosphate guanylyltransferase/mannose-6-phosphate isomerase n=1 Tax=Propylenella binzhouense TaxID=2555902 RepID=UPI00248440C1|nr:mannose-1-phosphate guanylyltransferase/mannose-6-phosphate isomerase [Propylenella binzhouense]
MTTITPTVLSGGSGMRLWPASRSCHPKQFLTLTGERSLLQNTLLRFSGEAGFGRPVVVGSEEHRFLLAEQARACGVELAGLLVEPVARDTAPAIAAACRWICARDAEALVLVMPADHRIAVPARLAEAVRESVPVAEDGWLVTFGIEPASPETGYGYVARGPEALSAGVWRAKSFVEKPDRARAEAMIAAGGHYWNSGLFLFRARTLLAELERLAPAIASAAAESVETAAADLDFVRLGRAALERSPASSIDYAVMQRSERVAIRPVSGIGWSDIGSWNALYDASRRDEHGNAALGDARFEDSARNYAYISDGRLLATLGVDDIVVVSTPDAMLVSRRDRAHEIKPIVDRLRTERPELVLANRRVHRPWGHFETIDRGERHQVKHICVKPGGRLSLQRHLHRAEHWVVVKGTARVTRGGEVVEITENESVYLPLGTRHRLENPGRIPLSLIEVQTGSYLGEDDVERLDDVYGRD